MRRIATVFLFIIPVLSLSGLLAGCDSKVNPKPLAINGSGNEYLFCFWNVENFFDDVNDHRTGQGDKEFDAWYAANPDMLKLKLEKMTEALLSLNGGKGPDILAMCEVESVRAAELLQKALNAKLPDATLHYQEPVMKEINLGRHIAPAILTRLPVVRDRTRTYGNRFRIVGSHIKVGDHELIVLASHWTSRLKDGEKGRLEYADKLYGAAHAMYKSDPKVDVLVCGDFNDAPKDISVSKHLHGTGDLQAVQGGGALHLFNLMQDKDPAGGFGTIYYRGWDIFDQILVTPGMLDTAGWSCDPASVQTVQSLSKPGDGKRRPWRFGGENEKGPRGYSDHFPVTAKLRVHR